MPPPTASVKPAAGANGSTNTTSDKLMKPDQQAYNAEMEEVKKLIEEVKVKVNEIRSKLDLIRAPTSGNDRRTQIRAEMDSLVGKQGEARSERQKTLESVKRLQESVQLKIKDIQSQRSKMPFKSIEEVESRIAVLEKSIESGTLKLIDEKKALHEISTLRRSKNALNGLNTVEVAIAEDRARIDELKKVLDDPETKKKMAKYEELKKELDDLKQQGNKVYEERNALYDERNALQKQMDELYDRKREVSQTYRDKNDAYYAKVAEERKAKQDRFRAEKQEEEAAKRKEDIARMREDAQSPAFAAEIEDTGVLIGWFQGKYGDASSAKVPQTHAGANASADKAVLEGVKKLEIRKVDEAPMDGMVLKKKGGEDEESFFMGGGSGKKGKKGSKQAGAATTSPKASSTPTPSEPSAAATTNTAINLPMGLLTALLSLGISPPTNKDDTTRVIADLEHKRDWFLANQEKKTKEEVERVEKVIAKMEKKGKQQEQSGDEPEILDEVEEAKEQGIKEPVHTVDVPGTAKLAGLSAASLSVEHGLSPVPSDDDEAVHVVDEKLEQVKETNE